MVKKTKLRGNEIPVEPELDSLDFDYDFGEPKDDRSPVHKILASVGTGAKDAIKDTSYIKRLLRVTLPPVYGEVDDAVTLVGSNFRKLYNTAAKEIKPGLAELSRATQKLIPEKYNKTKSGINRIKSWSEEYKPKTFTNGDKNAIRDKNIAIEIADIFSAQSEQQEAIQEENKADSKIKESLEMLRHRDSQNFLSRIDNNLSRLTQYQDKITQAYQRKSLELQYRNYFFNVESLDEAKQSNASTKTALLSIIKNTALPEFVKIKNSERFMELARTKTMETMFGGTQAFINKSFTNLGNIVKEYTEAAKDGLMSATSLAEATDMMSDDFSGKSLKEKTAELGTKGLVQYGFMRGGSKVRNYLSKNDKVNKIAGQAKYGLDNFGELATDAVNNENFEDGTFKTLAKAFGREIFGNQKPDSSLQADGSRSSIDPGMFSKFTNKSITEIIPGFLSRIFRELQVIRSGDNSVKLTSYDIYSNKFSDNDTLKKSFIGKLIPKGAVTSHQETGKEIFKLIDPENKLSEEERSKLLDKLTSDKFNKVLASPDRLSNKNSYSNVPGMEDSAEKISDVFKSYFTDNGKYEKDSNEYLNKRNRLSSSISHLGRFLNNPSSEIQNLINSGYYEQLREMGLIDELGNTVNMDEVLKRHNQLESDTVSESLVSENVVNNRSRRNKTVTRKQNTVRDNGNNDSIISALTDNSKLLKEFLDNNKAKQINFEDFINNQKDNFANLPATLNATGINVKANTTDEILTRIETILTSGIHVDCCGGSKVETFDPADKGYYKDTIFNNLKGVVSKTYKGIAGIARPINKSIIGAGKFALGSSFGLAKGILNKASNLTDSIADIFIKARDIYIDGENVPRLTKHGLKAGLYFDSITKKVINSLDDIKHSKGDIVDQAGNVLLLQADKAKTFVKSLKGPGIVRIGKALIAGGFNAFKKLNSVYFSMFTAGIKTIGKIKDTVFGLLDQPIDIYVRGIEGPVMLAIIMKAGGYVSEQTNKVIKTPSDIDGPVKDLKGNYVLTLDQLKSGLLDVNLKPIKTPLAKIFSAVMAPVKLGIRGALKIGKFGYDTIKGGIDKGGQFIKDLFSNLSMGLGGKQSLNVLEQIRNILDDRLPSNKNSFNDKDGDGVRDGSYLDLDGNRRDDDNDRTDPTVDSGRENTFDRLARGVSSIKNKVAGLFGMGDDEDDDGVDIDTRGRGGRRRRRSRGKRGLGGRVLGKGARILGSGASLLGRGALAAGSLALPAVASAAGSVVAGGSALLGGLGAALTGIAGLLSAPVVLGAAAVGLAGYGAYKLYKYMNKPNMEPLSKLRMAQYGFTLDDEQYIGKVQSMETKLMSLVKFSESGATLEIDQKTVADLLPLFDIKAEPKNTKEAKNIEGWTTWFNARFKPVFLTHMTGLNKIDNTQKLDEVDKMSPDLKLKYLEAVSFREGPYDVYSSPFPDLKSLQAGTSIVLYNIDLVKKAIEEEVKKTGDKKTKLNATNTVAAATAAVVAADAVKNTSTNKLKDSAQPFSLTRKLMDFVTKSPLALVSPFAALGVMAVKVIGPIISKRFGFSLSPLETIRFKTYGLVDMDRTKVMALRNLENYVSKNINYVVGGAAAFNGSLAELFDKVSSDFSIPDPNSDAASNWVSWFNNRFLPVYLNYISLVKQITGSDNLEKSQKALNPSNELEIAKKLIVTPAVWVFNTSPWKDYILNSDIKTTDLNIKYLQDSLGSDTLPEKKSTDIKNALSAVPVNIKAAASTTPDVAIPAEKTIADTKTSEFATSTKALEPTGYKDKFDLLNSKPDNKIEVLKNTVPGTKKPKGSFSGFGEDIDKYIKEASEMYGIDEKVLRGFVKMEAGYTGKMSPTGAIGTGQFIKSTWDSLAKSEEGKKIGMTPIGERFRTAEDPRHDKRINTLATGLLAKQNSAMLTKAGLDSSGEMLYMMHNIGPGVINAVKTGNVSPATLKAMQQNGMKDGMTPAGFVEYQKGRFNNHYALANNVQVASTKSATDGAAIGRDRQSSDTTSTQVNVDKSFGQNVEVTNPTAVATIDKRIPTKPAGNSGSYSGSVENTKIEPGIASTPQFTKEQLPKERSPFKTQLKRDNSMGGFNINGGGGIQSGVNYDMNKALSGFDKTLLDSLNVQKEMLNALREISGKINLENLLQKLNEGKSSTTEPAPRDNPQFISRGRSNQSETKAIPKTAVPMTRT